jgi:hypothetical protein
MYQDSLGTNPIKYKKKRHEADEEPENTSDAGDFPERVEMIYDVTNPF